MDNSQLIINKFGIGSNSCHAPSFIDIEGTYAEDIFCNFTSINKENDYEELNRELLDNTTCIQEDVANYLNEATKITNKRMVFEEAANQVVNLHKQVLEKLTILDSLRIKINNSLTKNVRNAVSEIIQINEFISYIDAGGVELKPIELEQINSITLPPGYNSQDMLKAIDSLNDYELVTDIVMGGLGISTLFSSSKAKSAVAVATGIIAVGTAILSTIEKGHEIKDQCSEIVSCMKKNVDVITKNIEYLYSAVDKIHDIERMRNLTNEYFNIVIENVKQSDFFIYPKEAFLGSKISVSPIVITNLKNICDTFNSIANRKYINQEAEEGNDTALLTEDSDYE